MCACAWVCRLLSQVRALSPSRLFPRKASIQHLGRVVWRRRLHYGLQLSFDAVNFLACCRNAAWPDSQCLWYVQQSMAVIIDHKAPFIACSIVLLHGFTMLPMCNWPSGLRGALIRILEVLISLFSAAELPQC